MPITPPDKDDPLTHVNGFKGLNNRLDPSVLGMEWQLDATGVLSDDAQYLVNQPSTVSFMTDIKDIFGTKDGRLFVISTNDTLSEISSTGIATRVTANVTGAPFEWIEIGNALFLMSADDRWAIYPDRVVHWGIPEAGLPYVVAIPGTLNQGRYLIACVLEAPDGRVGGCTQLITFILPTTGGIEITAPQVAGYVTRVYMSDINGLTLYYLGDSPALGAVAVTNPLELMGLGHPMPSWGLYEPPQGIVMGRRNTQLVVADWEPELDRSVLYFSAPDAPHLFDLQNDFWVVPGRITVLATIPQGLVIGTDREIFVNTPDGSLQKVADYGALPGTAAYDDFGSVMFWTDRGLCSAPPFTNLTDDRYVPANRVSATGAILPWKGSIYYLCAQHGPLQDRYWPTPHVPLSITSTRTHGVSL